MLREWRVPGLTRPGPCKRLPHLGLTGLLAQWEPYRAEPLPGFTLYPGY